MGTWNWCVCVREKEMRRGGNETDAFFCFGFFLRLFLQAYLSFKLFYYIQSLGSLLFAISN